MKVISTNKVEIYDDNNERIILEESETQNSISDFAYKKMKINAGESDYEINLVKSALEFIYIYTDKEISVKINNITGEERTINENGMYIFASQNIDKLYISNSGTENATITFVETNTLIS